MNAQFYFDTGMMFIEKRKYEEAISCFEESVKLNPNFSDAYFGIGVCKIKLGDAVNGEKAIVKSAKLGNIQAQKYIDSQRLETKDKVQSINCESNDKIMPYITATSCDNNESYDAAERLMYFKILIANNLNTRFATRWPRFFARTFDIWWETLLITLLLGMILRYYSVEFANWIRGPWADQIFGMFCLPAGLILDAVLYIFFGNTPGKALLGLKVCSLDDRPLNYRQYLNRNYSVWIKGIAFGLPVVNIFTMLYQFSRLGIGRQASYDEYSGYRVRANPIGLLRKVGFALAFFGVSLIMTTLNNFDTSAKHGFTLNNASETYSWKNPTTHINAKIDSRWKHSAQTNSSGQQINVFSEKTSHSVVVFAIESVAGYTLKDYVEAFQKRAAATMQFSSKGNFFEKEGHQTWQGYGSADNKKNNRLYAQVVQIGNTFWRVVTVQAMPYDYTESLVAQLQTALWSTVR
ncbi:MAG TPA: RDD family protein [Solidesulfovibrio magneticus]|nr:RDD family protein [Solidesulfovibrio magneticus]